MIALIVIAAAVVGVLLLLIAGLLIADGRTITRLRAENQKLRGALVEVDDRIRVLGDLDRDLDTDPILSYLARRLEG